MNEIICSSCIGVDASKFDVQIVDPPYSAYVHKNTTSNSPGRGVRHNDLGFDSLSDELRKYIANAAGRVKRWSIIYSDIEGLGLWRAEAALAKATYIRAMPWVRWSSPQLSGDRPPQGFELVTAYWGTQMGRKSWNGPGNLTHLSQKALRGEGKHKAEKPLDQALDLVTWFSNPGEHVFDPCAGSGTIGLACKILGRGYTGYEIDPVWAARAARRIQANTLNARDQERYERWQVTHEEELKTKQQLAAHTAKIRAKNGLANAAGTRTELKTDCGGELPATDSKGGGSVEEGQVSSFELGKRPNDA